MKRRLTMSESDRPKITPAPAINSVKAKSTRSKEGTSSQRPHFKDDPNLKDLFGPSDEQEAPFNPDNKRARRASNPSSSRPVITNKVKQALSTGVKGEVKAVRRSDIGPSSTATATVQPSKNVSLTSMATGQVKSTKKQDVRSSSMEMVRRVDNSSNHSHNSKSRDHTQTAAYQNKSVETDNRKVAAPSSVQRSDSTSTAKHILDSISRPNKERPATSGQTIRSKAIQAYGTGKSSISITTKKSSVSFTQPAGPSAIPVSRPKDSFKDQRPISSHPIPPPPVMTTAPASESQTPPMPTARLELPTQSAKPSQPLTQAVPLPEIPAQRVTPPTSPTTRALVGFIGPTVAALRASREAEIIHEDTSREEDTSLDSLEGPNIVTPHIVHVPVDSSVPRLASLSPHMKREESPDLGSESSYYDRSLYGPSSPACLPGADCAQLTTGIQPMNGSPSANGGHSGNGGQSSYGGPSVNGGPSNFGARSLCEDVDPDALDDDEFELLVYGERTEGRTRAVGDEPIPMDESSDAEAMDICSEDGDPGPTRNGGPAHGDPVQQWRADVV